MVLIQTQPGGLSYEGVPYALPRQAAPVASLEAAAPALLSQQPTLPRELRNDEVGALIRASDDDSRLVMLLLLSGLNLDEALDLRWSDIDLPAGLIHVNGASARDIVVNEALRELLAARHSASGADLLLGTPRLPATRDSIDAQILCAAHDAGIADATNVTSECLWHTYVSYLVRQGIRFADLTRLVGQLPAQIVGAYSALAPAGTRVGSAEVDLVHPALRKRNV
jgi:integrase